MDVRYVYELVHVGVADVKSLRLAVLDYGQACGVAQLDLTALNQGTCVSHEHLTGLWNAIAKQSATQKNRDRDSKPTHTTTGREGRKKV